MVEPNNFPLARKGLEQPRGGFGFNGPSEAWLKANGYQSSYNGHSGSLDTSNLSAEEQREKRQRALDRFDNPEHNQPTPILIPEPKPERRVSDSEIREKQRIAELREQNLIRNQMELDNQTMPHEESPQAKPMDEEKRKKCLSLANIKKEQARIVPKAQNSTFLNLLESGQGDFFIVAKDCVKVPAHKVILSARSNYFNVILTSDSIEARTGELSLTEFSEEAIYSMLGFLYSGQVRASNNNILELIYLADYLKLEHLKLLIQLKLCEFVSIDNLIDLWTLSEEMNLFMLRVKCEEFMKAEKEVRKIVPDMPNSLKSTYTQLIKKK